MAGRTAAFVRPVSAFNSAPPPEPALRMEPDFDAEYPGADILSTECAINLVRAGEMVVGEINRRLKADFNLSSSAGIVLAIIDGAGGPVSPTDIAERATITSGSVTSMLDTLEKRGFITRIPHPTDRRRLLVALTDAGRDAVDTFLPGVYQLQKDLMAPLSRAERQQLLALVAKVQASARGIAARPAPPLGGVRNVPARLGRARPA